MVGRFYVRNKFGCNWPEWFARAQGIWRQIFEKCQIPTPCLASPPRSPAGLTLIGALGPVHTNAFSERIDWFTSTLPFWCVYDCPHRETFEDDRMARCDISRRKLNSLCMLQTDAFAIFQVVFPFTASFSFWCVFNRLRPSSLIWCITVLIHFQERFQIDEFLMKTLSVLV